MKQFMWVIKSFILIATIATLISCGTKNEGCTDANASNFDVSADENCCCTYPTMGITFNFLFDDTVVSAQNPVIDANGDIVSIPKINFYISDIRWTYLDGSEHRSDKRVWIFTKKPPDLIDSIRTIDDYYLINQASLTLQNYTFYEPFRLTKLKFLVGVTDSAVDNQPKYMKNVGHPLAAKTDSMYDYVSGQYKTMKLYLDTNSIIERRDTFSINTSDARQNFEFDLNYKSVLGFDNKILINVHIDKLIEGISFRNDDKNTIVQKLSNNLKNIFGP